jgi:hypothetical protein
VRLKNPACFLQDQRELSVSECGRVGSSQRRPADVYLPSWGARGPAALDLACTSGMRGSVSRSSRPRLVVGVQLHPPMNTGNVRTTIRSNFVRGKVSAIHPFSPRGMWRRLGTALATWRKLGWLHAARVGLAASAGTDQLLQALAVALQRENARAVLRRLPVSAADSIHFEEP